MVEKDNKHQLSTHKADDRLTLACVHTHMRAHTRACESIPYVAKYSQSLNFANPVPGG